MSCDAALVLVAALAVLALVVAVIALVAERTGRRPPPPPAPVIWRGEPGPPARVDRPRINRYGELED